MIIMREKADDPNPNPNPNPNPSPNRNRNPIPIPIPIPGPGPDPNPNPNPDPNPNPNPDPDRNRNPDPDRNPRRPRRPAHAAAAGGRGCHFRQLRPAPLLPRGARRRPLRRRVTYSTLTRHLADVTAPSEGLTRRRRPVPGDPSLCGTVAHPRTHQLLLRRWCSLIQTQRGALTSVFTDSTERRASSRNELARFPPRGALEECWTRHLARHSVFAVG